MTATRTDALSALDAILAVVGRHGSARLEVSVTAGGETYSLSVAGLRDRHDLIDAVRLGAPDHIGGRHWRGTFQGIPATGYLLEADVARWIAAGVAHESVRLTRVGGAA